MDAITTAAARYVNAAGQVVLDWNVTVLSAEGRWSEDVMETRCRGLSDAISYAGGLHGEPTGAVSHGS